MTRPWSRMDAAAPSPAWLRSAIVRAVLDRADHRLQLSGALLELAFGAVVVPGQGLAQPAVVADPQGTLTLFCRNHRFHCSALASSLDQVVFEPLATLLSIVK